MDMDSFVSDHRLRVVLEPVVSLRQKCVTGVEARLRGDTENVRGLAVGASLAVELDRWYRREALVACTGAEGNGLFFLEFDSAVLDMGVAGSGHLADQVKKSGLDPASIVITIRSSEVKDTLALKDFTERYRRQGFLIALKDLGEGHSNLERMALVRPDILKMAEKQLDRAGTDFVSQEILKFLTTLSRKTGALLAVEGLATEPQVLTALDHGVDMVQGPLFSTGDLPDRIESLALQHKTLSIEQSKSTKKQLRDTETLLSGFLKNLSGVSVEEFNTVLAKGLRESPLVECLFIVDEKGVQESETHTQSGVAFKRNALFHPARPGADHSLKEYYYLLTDTFVNRFRTDPYVSLASGRLCVTLSGLFRDNKNTSHILCMDVPWN